MRYTDVMKELKSMGTAQNRKVYARHGVGGEMFGVSYANLGRLQKKIRTDHELAEKLWASGNHDARVLATMIADPAQMKAQTLERWAKDLDSYVITDAFSGLAGRTPFARKKMEKWIKSRKEWLGSAGWNLVAALAAARDGLEDGACEDLLETIEAKIHQSPNRVRHSMNNAIINIGLRSTTLEKKAKQAAKHIGKVEVDHGQTSCTTPDAAAYIDKTQAYRKKRKR